MDMTQFIENGNPFLRTDILKEMGLTEIKAKIKDVRKKDFEDGTKPILDITHNDKGYGFVLNKTNTNTIIDLYGNESDKWIGEEITIRLEKTDYAGKRVDCLRVI